MMKNLVNTLTLLTVLCGFSLPGLAEANPVAIIHTSKGSITLELYRDKAPITVANFIDYAQSGFYSGTIFHRVKKRFMIQGGGFTVQLEEKTTKEPIVNEAKLGLYNDRGTIAMARTNDPDSATSQFFINTKMNTHLDKGRGKAGYAVFGKVVDGMWVVKAIEKTSTQAVGVHANLPVEPIIIERVEIKPAQS